MRIERLEALLQRFRDVRIGVAGDFFLDTYWEVDPRLAESSLETGLEAHQVTNVRFSPGAAGTVTNNLVALGAGKVEVIGVVGRDGNGHILRMLLDGVGVGTSGLIAVEGRITPTYTKPMRRGKDGIETEMSRFDLRSRSLLPEAVEGELISLLEECVARTDALIVLDQVVEEGQGMVTTRLRERIGEMALSRPEKFFLADSRMRIGLFRNTAIKANEYEAQRATGLEGAPGRAQCEALQRGSGRPVFLTRGRRGIAVFDGLEYREYPAVPVSGPIDIVGAGDSVSAAVVTALSAEASLWEAAQIGILASAVTIRKLGTTGTASPSEILEMAGRHRSLVESWV